MTRLPEDSESRANAAGNRQMKMAEKSNASQMRIKKNKEQKKKKDPIQTSSDVDTLNSKEFNKVLNTRNLLADFGAGEKESDFEKALDRLEQFLGTTKAEYEDVENLTNVLLKEMEKLTVGIESIGDVLDSESVA
ncbi:Protein CBG27320 [Caenorhabditis briggsae]|uniref:Uncharacterized protein n=2 Tax=Caenorhabditis briggsae TaxID=6238 RepID=A0AAE9A8J1_CAEBR|nr:Protein CBG27320 [Caenorhabditis briggsae]ULT92656.1 hypothetical protein L3Y34_010031 [Caenorhabditis briggsae]CAR98882.1 Protein CBG27320 [Caenorhabditis briggsae]